MMDDCYGVLDSLKDLLELDNHEISDTEDNILQNNKSSNLTKSMSIKHQLFILQNFRKILGHM